jgi:hypothetical protein
MAEIVPFTEAVPGMESCAVESCERRSRSDSEWCSKHHRRWVRTGHPLGLEGVRTFRLAWIAAAVTSATDDCIVCPWAGAGRYAMFYEHEHGAMNGVHQIVCEQTHGPCPDGLECCHSCGNTYCANPRHLRWDTHTANMGDRKSHGTDNAGERSGQAKLNWYAVHWIRSYWATGDYTQTELGRMFALSPGQVNRIVNNKRWVANPITPQGGTS